MRNIRIGKDITCRWKVAVNGDEGTSLDGMNLRLVLHDPFGNHPELPFGLEKNTVTFMLAAGLQAGTGRYSVTLFAEKDGKHTALDACDFVRLVSTTCEEDPSQGKWPESVDLAGSIALGVQGDSAYQSWLNQGHEGSESDFLEWLRTPSSEIYPVIEDLGEQDDL